MSEELFNLEIHSLEGYVKQMEGVGKRLARSYNSSYSIAWNFQKVVEMFLFLKFIISIEWIPWFSWQNNFVRSGVM